MKNILITGGAGFIGSHIVDVLINDGHNVIVVDNFMSPGSGYKNTKAQYIEKDILAEDFENIFKQHTFDICIHLAANPSVALSADNPVFDATQNIIGSINVITLCKKYNLKKLIVASSAAVYGTPNYLPVDEKHQTQPLSNYGISKLAMEKYVQISGLDYIIFRFANVYGERQNAQGEAGVIAIFNNLMKQNKQVYIDDDGEQTRDFIYVKDIAKAVSAAVVSPLKNEIINVSTNKSVSINNLFHIMASCYDYKTKPLYREKRQGDIKNSILDNKKLNQLIDTKQLTELHTGISNLKQSTKKI